ncbi:MAG: Gfo/Idh/MocA family oxidoreductase [Pseudomonadota bacterium]
MNVLMIGAGMVAQTHVLALRDNRAGARLMGVLGRDGDRLSSFCEAAAQTLGYEVEAFTDLEVATRAGPDMALLITPPDARAGFAAALAAAGVPTLMEKPVERTLEAARAVVDVYARAKVPLALCFQHRTRAAAQDVKQRLASGALGEIVHVEVRVPWWRDQGYYDAPGRGSYARDGGGVMINQAIHTVDLALWLAGPVVRVQAIMRTSPLHRMEAEDIAGALLDFRSGASGILSATTAAYPGGAESISLITTKAHVHLAGDSLRINWLSGQNETRAPEGDAATGGGADPMAFTHGWHQALLEDFVVCVAEGRMPIAPPVEALRVHAVIDAMERAARTGEHAEVAA